MSPKNSLRKALLVVLALTLLSTAPAFSAMPTEPFPNIQGWTLAVDPSVYTPDNLWNIIDGAADAYLLYGFETLHIGEYLTPDSVDVRAELYAHSSPANAFGIYSQERKPEYNFLEMSTEGYLEDGVLNFLCGRYYVKLTSHTMGARGREALREAARRLDSHLGQKKGFPPQLTLLPSEGKIPRSESYIADSYLGYSFFHSAYVAQYGDGGKVQLFVMEFDSPASARSALERYGKTLHTLNGGVRDGNYTLADPNNGPVGMVLTDRYLGGVVYCEEREGRDEYLARLEKSIRNEKHN